MTVGPDVSIGEAAGTLHAHKIGSVVVTDADGVVLGIFTDAISSRPWQARARLPCSSPFLSP